MRVQASHGEDLHGDIMDMDIVYRNGRMVEGKNERWGFVGKPLTTVVTDSGLI